MVRVMLHSIPLLRFCRTFLNYGIDEHYIRSVLKYEDFLIKTRPNYNNSTDKAIKMRLMKVVYDPSIDNYITVATPAGISYFVDFFTKERV